MGERLSSRLGFILLSAGCAIGIGNVWRFPYVTGLSGGGWFVLIYLFFLAVLGIPVLAMELAAGRAARHSIARLHEALVPERRAWRIHGALGCIGNTVLMMFYTTVTAWMVLYFLKELNGSFKGMEPKAVEAAFGGMLADPWQQVWAMVGVCVGSSAVCAIGLQRGLERVTKVMMLMLLVLIVALSVNSVLLDGSGEGLRFYLLPNAGRLRSVGVATVIANAMNQAFFTLSLGIGAMAIFGSYVDRRRALLGEAVNIAALDTVVAVCAGLIIIPACFAYGIEPGQGPGLIFVTLPNVFNKMPLGRLWGGAVLPVHERCRADDGAGGVRDDRGVRSRLHWLGPREGLRSAGGRHAAAVAAVRFGFQRLVVFPSAGQGHERAGPGGLHRQRPALAAGRDGVRLLLHASVRLGVEGLSRRGERRRWDEGPRSPALLLRVDSAVDHHGNFRRRSWEAIFLTGWLIDCTYITRSKSHLRQDLQDLQD